MTTGQGTPDLDALLASIESGRSIPPPPRPPRGPRRGFLDLLAVSLAMYALVVATPVGQLLERGYNAAFGRRAKTRSLISYFEMDSGGSSRATIEKIESIVEAPKARAPVSIAAKRAGVPADVARAVVVMASGGEKIGENYDVQLLASGRASFDAVGVPWPSADASAKLREKALVDAVAKLSARLGGFEPAVAATVVELSHVAYAVDRARASGAERPTSYSAFAHYLPRDAKTEADPLVRGTFALVTAFDMRWPVPHRTRISSPFGLRTHPVLGTRKMHTGTDLAVAIGTEIRAIADAVVLHAGEDSVNGKFVKLDHGNGLSSAYCHASELGVKRGQRVAKGDVIMKSGATGRVSGAHLHFEMKLDGQRVDPELFKKAPPRRASLGR